MVEALEGLPIRTAVSDREPVVLNATGPLSRK
jgi:hypothetical protein